MRKVRSREGTETWVSRNESGVLFGGGFLLDLPGCLETGRETSVRGRT